MVEMRYIAMQEDDNDITNEMVKEDIMTTKEQDYIVELSHLFDEVHVAYAIFGAAVQIRYNNKQVDIQPTETGYAIKVPAEQLRNSRGEGLVSVASANKLYTALQSAKDRLQ